MKNIKTYTTLILSFFFVTTIVANEFNVVGGEENIEEVSTEKGIDFFDGTFQEALQKAKKENKLIFIDAYASWCMPCKVMGKTVFSTNRAGEFFNHNFINLKIDMEKGEGPKFAYVYGVRAYPSLIFINANGEVKNYAIGFHTTPQLIDLGKQTINKWKGTEL